MRPCASTIRAFSFGSRYSRLDRHGSHRWTSTSIPVATDNFLYVFSLPPKELNKYKKIELTYAEDSPRFPGAVDSPFSSKMEWIIPAEHSRIPTFRILNMHNQIEDPAIISDIPREEIVQWYKNMVTGVFG
jgi:hypothetical protein